MSGADEQGIDAVDAVRTATVASVHLWENVLSRLEAIEERQELLMARLDLAQRPTGVAMAPVLAAIEAVPEVDEDRDDETIVSGLHFSIPSHDPTDDDDELGRRIDAMLAEEFRMIEAEHAQSIHPSRTSTMKQLRHRLKRKEHTSSGPEEAVGVIAPEPAEVLPAEPAPELTFAPAWVAPRIDYADFNEIGNLEPEPAVIHEMADDAPIGAPGVDVPASVTTDFFARATRSKRN